MNEPLPTLLIIYLCPEHDEEAHYYVIETLTTAGIAYRLIAERVQLVSLQNAALIDITHAEKQLAFSLSVPIGPEVIYALAQLVTTGLIFGFAIKGEITLGGAVGVINNLVE
jgi:hypothetical protein